MTKRICWKKGMRLSDELFKASDNCQYESLSHAFTLATAGRFGLLPSVRKFDISISINKAFVEIESLNCLAITKSGELIDINYDTTFTNSIDSRLPIPTTDETSLLLIVQPLSGKWVETHNGFCEPAYTYGLLPEHTPLEANQFPIAKLVNEYGWRLDDIDFVPPCLYISSHPIFVEFAKQFCNILKITNSSLTNSIDSNYKTAIGIFWPVVQLLKITMDKEIDLITPMMLFGNLQKFISAFLSGCMLDENVTLTEINTYQNYIELPYNYKDVYTRIKEGLSLCSLIAEKVEKFKECTLPKGMIEAPTISSENMLKKCTNNKVKIPINNNCPGSTIYYTTDGSEPSYSSGSGDTIVLSTEFVGGREKEDDKIVTVKVKAFLNGISSNTNSYKIRLQKDVKHWIEI